MDLQLLSATASPTMSTLLSDSTLDPMLYDIKSSYPLLSRQRVGIKASANWGYGKTETFSLNRYGILVGLVLKMVVTAAEASVGDRPVPSLNHGHSAVVRATLSSHSREIEQITSDSNLARTLDLPIGARENIMAVSKSNDPTALAVGANNIYVPLHFSFTKNGLSSALDLTFIEQVEVQVELAAVGTNALGLYSANVADAAFTPASCELLCYYLNANEATLRGYEDKEFSLQKPLSMMMQNVYKEAVYSTTSASDASSTSEEEFTISLNVPNVVSRTIITLYNSTDDNVGVFHAINNVEFKISGRSVYDATGDEIQKLENALFFGSSYGIGAIGVGGSGAIATDSNQNIYIHNWQVANERNRFCGGVSGKNCSDFSITIKYTPGAASKVFKCVVNHDIVQIVSISGASGKVGVSLSL